MSWILSSVIKCWKSLATSAISARDPPFFLCGPRMQLKSPRRSQGVSEVQRLKQNWRRLGFLKREVKLPVWWSVDGCKEARRTYVFREGVWEGDMLVRVADQVGINVQKILTNPEASSVAVTRNGDVWQKRFGLEFECVDIWNLFHLGFQKDHHWWFELLQNVLHVTVKRPAPGPPHIPNHHHHE